MQEVLTQETALETGKCGAERYETTASKNQEDMEPKQWRRTQSAKPNSKSIPQQVRQICTERQTG
jgi:hypothetical protein